MYKKGIDKINGKISHRYTIRLVILVFLFILTLIGLVTVSAVSASSAIIYVNGSHGNDANDGLTWATAKLTIKNATGTVATGGTVNIANGVYKGENNTNILINRNMTIKGQSKSGTIINGTNDAQIFRIEKTSTLENINVIIQNLTIVNGTATSGGAIYNTGTLTVQNCAFKGNNAVYGGAIYNTGILNMTGCILSEDNIGRGKTSNPGMGGAIYNTGTSTISYNSIPHKNQHPEDFGDEFDLNIINDGGTVNAELNWWGTNKGPENHIQGFTVTKWLVLTINLPSSILINKNFNITADLRHDNNGTLHTGRYLPNGIPVTFYTRLPNQYQLKYVFTSTVNGIAQATFKSAYGGATQFSASVDNQIVAKSTKIIDYIPPKVILTYPKNGATGVSRTATITIKFSENIKASYNWPKIYVKNLNTGRIVSLSKWISGNKLYIKMNAKRYAYNWYQVYIPKAAVKDYSSNKLASYYTFKFKTGKYPLTYE